jgi:hypothetical protein
MERFQPEWIDAPVRVRHPAVIGLKMAVGGLFVAPAVAIWAICFGAAMIWIGGKRAARYAFAVYAPETAPLFTRAAHPESLTPKSKGH